MKEEDYQLIEIAKKHIKECYKPNLSTISAALRTKNGKIFTGTNFKYRVRTITMCAERLAIFKAIEAGETEFDTIVGVKYFPEEDRYQILSACGECRQVQTYHAPIKTIIDDNGELKLIDIEELLPFAFK